MCGIVGLFTHEPVNQKLYDALLVLQHRGQDAAGISTLDNDGLTFHMHKGKGLVKDIFRTRDMRDLLGNIGLGQVRYPTQGMPNSAEESQPFYSNTPYGIMFVHNGNLTHTAPLKQALYDVNHRHINTPSDSEVLLNVFADELFANTLSTKLTPELVFKSVHGLHNRVTGAYACIALIAGKGMLAFRDPFGIRPLCFGTKKTESGTEYMIASESCALAALEFRFERDVRPGEAVWIDLKGNFYSMQCADKTLLSPCIFEYVYLARPDSVLDGISVYAARLALGRKLAEEVQKYLDIHDIDVVMPIPDSSRPSAHALSEVLGLPYVEGFVKNRYIGRTFIMPGQKQRQSTVRRKLNPMPSEFARRNVLLVDDSIVRGTTMREIVRMAREAGAKKVFVASSAPRVCFPNVYGIDMPTRRELICGDGTDAEGVSRIIGADAVVFQTISGMKDAIGSLNPAVPRFDCSCFDGDYVAGDVDEAYLTELDAASQKIRELSESQKEA